jgi:acyl carrier protein
MINNFTQIEQKVIEFVCRNSHFDVQKITPKTMLFKEGIFDSMAVVLFIEYLEHTFGIKPVDEELIEENFESVAAITHFILRKKEVNVT